MLGASMFRYAGALEGLSRVALGGLAVGVSFELVHMLVSFENSVTAGIIALHDEHPFPKTMINGTLVPYILAGDPATSYRGIVMPMSRWGCAVNNFMGIVSVSFVTNTLESSYPSDRWSCTSCRAGHEYVRSDRPLWRDALGNLVVCAMGASLPTNYLAQLLSSDGSAGLWLLGITRGDRTKCGASVVQGIFYRALYADNPALHAFNATFTDAIYTIDFW